MDLAGVRAQTASGRDVELSTDPQFIDKVRDIVGLYVDSPANALVLCVDEKSQMQALDRTAPILPTTPARMARDYVRHGTTSLFAALDISSGSVIAEHHRRHRHQEFLRFLKTIDKAVPTELDLHLVCDNYGIHKTPEVSFLPAQVLVLSRTLILRERRTLAKVEMDALAAIQKLGSPQRSSQIILPNGSSARYGGRWTRDGDVRAMSVNEFSRLWEAPKGKYVLIRVDRPAGESGLVIYDVSDQAIDLSMTTSFMIKW